MGAGETGMRKGLKYSVKSFLAWSWDPVFTRSSGETETKQEDFRR